MRAQHEGCQQPRPSSSLHTSCTTPASSSCSTTQRPAASPRVKRASSSSRRAAHAGAHQRAPKAQDWMSKRWTDPVWTRLHRLRRRMHIIRTSSLRLTAQLLQREEGWRLASVVTAGAGDVARDCIRAVARGWAYRRCGIAGGGLLGRNHPRIRFPGWRRPVLEGAA